VRGTRALHARFHAAQLGVLRFQLVGDARNFLSVAVALGGGIAAAAAIGAVAGLYPALRAARLSPTDALRGV
jgi:ABC-type antimicrobial peptide transport system permease subunit